MESESAAPLINWHESLEEYLASMGEKSHCLSWCHKRAEELYSYRRTFIDLPVIMLSAITGFMSVGTSTMFPGQETSASIALGVCSLFVSVLNTTGAYFGWAKRSEGHRISSIHYSKLYRHLVVELSLPREERTPPTILLKQTREQYDRLQEISPLLPPDVVKVFKNRFEGKPEYNQIQKPEELNGLEHIQVYNPLRPGSTFPSSPLYNATPNPHLQIRVQDLPGRHTSESETRRPRPSSPAEERPRERRESGGDSELRSVQGGHPLHDSNP